MTDPLAEIRARDAIKVHSPAGLTMTQAEADRRALLREIDRLQHRLANPCNGEDCEDGGAAHCHRCAEVDADNLLGERDRLRAESQRLDAALEEERRLIDGERRAHEARAEAAAWFLEGARQSDGTYRPEPVGEAIRQLRAALDPQQFTKWPEDWAAHRAERDAARGAT
jgi:hypothetical protein